MAKKLNLKNKKLGFSLLFAVLTGSLVLSIGLAILSITIKQITLASAGRESQKAFYAADVGMECAMYFDKGGENPYCPQGILSVPKPSTGYGNCDPGFDGPDGSPAGTGYECAGYKFRLSTTSPDPDTEGFIYLYDSYRKDGNNYVDSQIEIKDPDGDSCFLATITKKITPSNELETQIVSRGYSTCNESSVNRFERAIKIQY